jgi:tol-pal system protein YbgF
VIRRSIRLFLVPAAVLAAGACFATRNDVRTLQGDLAVLRAENARSDSVHRAQFQLAAAQVGAVSDSLRVVNAFLSRFATDVSRFQGDLSISMHTFGQQLLTIQELVGQTQKRQQDLKAELERQAADLATSAQPTTVPSAPGAQGVTSGPPGGPGPLYEAATAQMRRASYAVARQAFQDFIEQFPANERASEALYNIARSYDLEGNGAAADSVYGMYIDKYPKADFAAPALYKRAKIAIANNQPAKAKEYLQKIIDSYPRSLEAQLAPDALKELLKKP